MHVHRKARPNPRMDTDESPLHIKKRPARITADLDHSLVFEGEAFLQRLKPRRRIDLFLFYKESLINIIRHSGATEVKTNLSADRNEFNLTITDNGHGLDGDVPSSLKRRARLLGAQVSSSKPESGGTRISLTLGSRRRWLSRAGSRKKEEPKSPCPTRGVRSQIPDTRHPTLNTPKGTP